MAIVLGLVFAGTVYGLALYGLLALLYGTEPLSARFGAGRGRHTGPAADDVPEPPPCPDCEAARLDAMGAYWLDSIEESRP